MGIYLKEFKHHIIDASRTDLSNLEKLDLELAARGGYRVYQYLHSLIVRELWEDHKGFPIKKKFHNNKLLACTVSIRKIAKFMQWGDQKVQKIIRLMEQLHWIEKNNQHTFKKQTVFILGTWHTKKDKDGKPYRVEDLFRDAEREKYIKQKESKPEDNDHSMYNFEDLHR